jgi:hypothetical protein
MRGVMTRIRLGPTRQAGSCPLHRPAGDVVIVWRDASGFWPARFDMAVSLSPAGDTTGAIDLQSRRQCALLAPSGSAGTFHHLRYEPDTFTRCAFVCYTWRSGIVGQRHSPT